MQQAGLWLVSLIAAVHRGAAWKKKNFSASRCYCSSRIDTFEGGERLLSLLAMVACMAHVCVCEQADVVKSFVFFFLFLLGNLEMLKQQQHQQQATELDPSAEDLCVHPSLIMQEECC